MTVTASMAARRVKVRVDGRRLATLVYAPGDNGRASGAKPKVRFDNGAYASIDASRLELVE